MANPNIVQTSAIYGVTNQVLPANAGPGGSYLVSIVADNVVKKVNLIQATNTSTTTDYEMTVYHNISGIGSLKLAANVVVPAKATIVISSSDSPVYLRPGDFLACFSNVVSTLTFTVSYEVIS
jgi:hypothetical protein